LPVGNAVTLLDRELLDNAAGRHAQVCALDGHDLGVGYNAAARGSEAGLVYSTGLCRRPILRGRCSDRWIRGRITACLYGCCCGAGFTGSLACSHRRLHALQQGYSLAAD
jgi:hypothetical protein